jgi:hypothetical protein
MATAVLPIWLALVLYADRALDLVPREQPERGRAILTAFFAGVLVVGAVQVAAWRCPACRRWMSSASFFTRRCPKCDVEFR